MIYFRKLLKASVQEMRKIAPSSSLVRFGVFQADLQNGLLYRQGVRIKLQEQPFRILALLLEHHGQVVTREEIRRNLWPDGTFVDFEGGLNAAMKKVRAALDDSSDEPQYIETIPKRGYRFIASVEQGEAPATAQQRQRQELTGEIPHGYRRRFGRLVTVASTLLIVGIAGFFAVRWGIQRADRNVARAASNPVPVRPSLAVLGFHNASGKSEDAWLAPAISEMLSTELAAGEKLRLVPGEDISNLRLSSPWSQTDTLGKATTTRIGMALNSDLLVLGSYTSIGENASRQLRLDVRLQDARTGEILTEIGETGGPSDLFRVVSDAGGKLRERLGVPKPQESEEASILATMPANPQAERFYSLGLVKMREYDYLSARVLLEQAIKADPQFPLAHSMLARAYIFLGHDDLAKTEAKRGLDFASSLPRAQKLTIEASYHQANGDRGKAADIYRVLFSLFPDSLDYGLQLAKLQLESYHPDEALATIRQLRRLPAPARDDPSIDLREAYILFPRDPAATDRLFHSAADKARAQGRGLIYAKAEENLCYVNRQHLQPPPECREAYETFLAAGNRDEAAYSLQLMAEAQRLTGHRQEAIPYYRQATGIFREIGDREKLGVTLNNLSLVFEGEGLWDQAERTYREAREAFQAVNDKANAAAATGNIANMLVLRGRLNEAAALDRQSWELAEASGRARPEPFHIQYASVLLMRGELEQARLEIEPQIASLRSFGADPWQLANALGVLGDIQKQEGDLGGAHKSYEDALQTLKTANASTASLQVSLAELSMEEGHADAAEPPIRQAIAEFEKDKSAGDELGGYVALARVLLAEGKVSEAQNAASRAAGLADLHEFPTLSLPLRLVQARASVAAAKPGMAGSNARAAAERAMREIVQRSGQLGMFTIFCEARLALGELELRIEPAAGRARLSALASDCQKCGFELISRRAASLLSVR